MKIYLTILTALLLITSASYSQTWHTNSDTLHSPSSQSHAQTSVSYFNRFDTVQCFYVVSGKEEVLRGYKYVFILQGFYTDTPNTVNIFFDDQKRRIFNVEKFYFN